MRKYNLHSDLPDILVILQGHQNHHESVKRSTKVITIQGLKNLVYINSEEKKPKLKGPPSKEVSWVLVTGLE